MPYIELDEYEKELIRFFAQRYRDHNDCVDYHEFPRYEEQGVNGINWARDRLTQVGVIAGEHSTGIKVLPTILEALELIENPPKPPLPDYRDKLTKWFFSKRWSVAVYILVVGLPALVGWVVMLKTLVDWVTTKH